MYVCTLQYCLSVQRTIICFRHIQQIEPARPVHRGQSQGQSQADKAGNQGKRASIWAGAWSLVQRARFKIAANVGRIAATARQVQALSLVLAGTRWLALAPALALVDSRWLFVRGQQGRKEGVSAQGPMAAVCWARLGSMNPKGGATAGEGRRENGAAADVSFSVGAPRDAPAGRIITGHWGQGPDLTSAGVVWLSQSRLHPPEKKSLPTKEPPASPSSCPVAPVLAVHHLPSSPPRALPASASQCHPVPGSQWSRPHLAQARACLVSRLVDKDRRAWLVVDIAV